MKDYITLPVGLRSLALVTASTSAISAYPVAEKLLGSGAATVAIATCTAIIMGSWQVASQENWRTNEGSAKGFAAATAATLLSALMVGGVYLSTDLNTSTAQLEAAKRADLSYQQQEQQRLSSLEKLTDELRVTSKNKNQAEYTTLQAQITALSKPTTRTKTQEQQALDATSIPNNYRIALSALFEIFTFLLLFLASWLSPKQQSTTHNNVTTTSNNINEPQAPQPTPTSPTGGSGGTPASASPAPSKTDAAIHAIAQRQLDPSSEGFITAKLISTRFAVPDLLARKIIEQAYQAHLLETVGEGKAKRYRYPTKTQLRSVA
ncbi:hypothetical protein [Thiolinea disciformis]|uniref:hypothetical protein n=1 Tax=Thiolinea disciformis TaxID=125614 RepID=UPI00036792AA|nr:hypothetical protein [Thiolinea disciformis]